MAREATALWRPAGRDGTNGFAETTMRRNAFVGFGLIAAVALARNLAATYTVDARHRGCAAGASHSLAGSDDLLAVADVAS